MGIFDAFKQKEADALVLSMDELPKPPNSAVFTIRHGQQAIAVSFIQLDDAGIEQACKVLAKHSAKIKACRYQRVEYQNVSDWTKSKLQAKLESLGL